MSSLDEIEDEILLQSALLESLVDAGVNEQSDERSAIEHKLRELEIRAEQLSAATTANDDSGVSRQHVNSSRSSVASDDDFPEQPIPGAWKPSSDAARGNKRPAQDVATGPSKRVATDTRPIPSSGPAMTAANRMERYRQFEEAARARSQRERQDAEFAAAMSRADSAHDAPASSQSPAASNTRPQADQTSLAPPFQRRVHPSVNDRPVSSPSHQRPLDPLPQRARFNPAPSSSSPQSRELKQEGPSHNIIRPSGTASQTIDLTDDNVSPADWGSRGSSAAAQKSSAGSTNLNLLPATWGYRNSSDTAHSSRPALTPAQAARGDATMSRLLFWAGRKKDIETRLTVAQGLSRRWHDYHTEMEARGFPPGTQGDSEVMKGYIKQQVSNAEMDVRRQQRELAMAERETAMARSDAQQPRPGVGSSRGAAYSHPSAANIYAPIKKESAGDKRLIEWGGPGLNRLIESARHVPRMEDPDQTDWLLPEIPDHYHADVDPPTDAQTAADIQNMFDNMYQDDEAALRAEEVELDSMTVNLKPYQGMGLNWLQRMEEGTNKGGILADDMGLGKTIQAIALMSTRRSEDPLCKTTLIVAPVALLRQWRQEIQDKLKRGRHAMSVFIHHGTTKKKSFEELRRYDVVLTTFGTLASEQQHYDRWIARKKADRNATMTPAEKGMFTNDNAHWYRVILDEAQNIKNKNTKSTQACCRLQSKYRLCMTGTPMMNSVDELYSLIHFLRIPPYNSYKKFQMDFTKPLKHRDEEFRKSAMVRLQALIKATLLRRHKKTKMNGRPILLLPERNVREDPQCFGPEELDFYKAVEENSQTQFNKYVKAGTVGKQYAHILVMLLRLRQACCHPHLIKDFGAVATAADISEDTMIDLARTLDEGVIKRIKQREGAFECPVCFEATENPAIFVPCGHDTCSDCFSKICEAARAEDGNRDAKCPNCRAGINTKRVVDYETFKKVHQPSPVTGQADEPDADDVETESDVDGDVDDDDDDETDSEIDSETEEEEGDGTLGGFIVADNEEDVGVDEDEIETASEAGDEGDLQPSGFTGPSGSNSTSNKAADAGADARPARKSRAGKKKRRRAKGKGKEKATDNDGRKKKKASGKKTRTLAELKKDSTKNKAAKKRYLAMIRKDWTSSSKIDATLESLSTIINETEEKVIVFSQWTSLLDLLEVPIDEKGWGYERYDGSMNAKARADAVDNFKDSRGRVRVMLISLKAGNAGLNLNTASRVIILDPFWNPFVEEQAIDRAHRLGQTRDVEVQRLLIKETVEDRIVELQEKKRAMINEALDEGAGQRLSRLSQAELGFLFGVRRLNQ